MRRAEPNNVDLLELDIDMRLASLWREVQEHEGEFSIAFIAALMRACYGRGYTDSLSEPEPGKLCKDHGYRVPAAAQTRR